MASDKYQVKIYSRTNIRGYHCSHRTENEAETPKAAPAAASSESVRSAMRQFLFRVHPDFFSKFPSVQQTNERALKQINQLLDILEDYGSRDGPIILDGNKVPKRTTVSFFLREVKTKTSDEDDAPEEYERAGAGDTKPKKGQRQFVSVSATLTFPDSFFNTPFPRQRLEHDCRVFINSLLKQAKLPILDVPDLGPAVKSGPDVERSDRHDSPMKGGKMTWAHEMRSMIYKALNRHMTEDQLILESLGGRDVLRWGSDGLVSDLIREEVDALNRLHSYKPVFQPMKKSVFFVPALTGEQKGIAAQAVNLLFASKRIPEDIPVVVTEGIYLTPSQLEGFVTLPYNFYLENPLNPGRLQDEDATAEPFDDVKRPEPGLEKGEGAAERTADPAKFPKLTSEQYLSLYLPTIIQQRARIREAINETELGLMEIMETLRLADLVVKVGVMDARLAVRRILSALPTLEHDSHVPVEEAEEKAAKPKKGGVPNIEDAIEDDEEDFPDVDEEDMSPEDEEFIKEFADKPARRQNQSDSRERQKRKSMEKKQREKATPDKRATAPSVMSAFDLLRNITIHIVESGRSMEYDPDRDVLFVPASTTAAAFKKGLSDNRAMLEVRQKLNPHALEFAEDYWRLLGLLKELTGAKEILLDGAPVKNKILQIHGAQTLKRHAVELRAMKLDRLSLVISERFAVDRSREYLYIPPVFEMQDLHDFLNREAGKLSR